MKMTVDFELDWVHDNDTIDEAVSRQIVKHAVSQVGEKVIKAIQNGVNERLVTKTDEFLEGVLSTFMTKNIVVTDKWGNEVARYESVNEVLEEKFDRFITEAVDRNGKTSRDRGGKVDGTARLEYLMQKHIDHKINNIKTRVSKEIDTYFQQKIKEAETSLHAATIEKYMKSLDFDAAIQQKA